jgi:hypothetical protein
MLTALLIALTPVTPIKQIAEELPLIQLKTDSLVFTNEVNHAVLQYCLTRQTKTLTEVEKDITSNTDTILKFSRLVETGKLSDGKISKEVYVDRYVSDTIEVESMIKKRAGKKCPSKD